MQLTPETMTLGVGQKQALFATAFDQRGNLIPNAKFTFRSSDTLIAQVRKDGTVIGLKPGLAKIEAQSQGRRASMAVLITGSGSSSGSTARAASASVLTLEPASLTLFPGETARIRAQALRDDRTPIAVGQVTIKSLRPDIARVDSGGLITGISAGRAIVQATSGHLMATLPVDVAVAEFTLEPSQLSLIAGATDTLRARVPSQGNRTLRAAIQLRSTDSAVVSVTADGIVRARTPGRVEIIASVAGQERRSMVRVIQAPEAIVVSPPQGGVLQIPLRSTRQFSAVAEAADSTTIPDAQIEWELSDSGVAQFDRATGVLTPKVLGTTTLTAKLPGITPAVWKVEVVPGHILVEPSRLGLLVGERANLAALLRDQNTGSTSSKPPTMTWTSDRGDVALVRGQGQVEALSPGHAVITAAAPWGKEATADVFVVADLWLSSNRSGAYGIYQLRSAGPHVLLPVLVDKTTNIQATLAPDRTKVAFSSNRTGNFDVFIMDADGQNVRRVTSSHGHDGEPTWTPDGARIVYTAASGTSTHVAIMESNGSEPKQLTTASGGNHSPTVSPDGRTIAFVSARTGNHSVHTMGLDGSNQRRLTKSSVRETNPQYSRTGELFYVTERGGGSRGSKVMKIAAGAGSSSTVLETDDPVTSFAVSREGDRLAYIVGRRDDRGKVQYSLYLQAMGGRRPLAQVPLQPGEQLSSLSF
ncbi:MAG TPA: Ig-like domain-containing protein [Gemmatimonadales bacterium]|nr:Ig-like domain-containing protein [Gemmatimonadales bacterium]